ncbi:mechanosensitive ion channel [Paraphaeosphaeria sporulosa]
MELEETSQVHASGSALHTSRRSLSADHQEAVRYEPFRRQGAYSGLSGGDRDDEEDQGKEPSKLQTLVYKFTKSILLRRLLLYYFPPTLLLLIPIVITATVAKNAYIGDDVRVVGLFVWLEVIWAIFWGSWGLAFVLPFVFQYFAGFFTPVAKDYTDILKAVILPMTAFYFALFSRAATPLLCVFDEVKPGRCDDDWIMIIRRFLLATIACTGLFFVQKVLIHLLTVNYRKRQFKVRVEESKRTTHILAQMYEASVRLYPAFCARFAPEDDKIHRSQTLRAAVEGGLQQPHLRKRVNKFYGADAMAETKARLQGKEVLKVGSPRSVVMKALENEQASEALARRLWFSFSMESDAVTEDDITRILGPGREEDALDIFHALDNDENGDISLEEMIFLLTQFCRDRKDIERSMHDIGQAIKSLDRILEVFLFFVSILLYIAFFNVGVTSTLATLWASVAAVSFAIATTVQEFLGSLVFLFIKHPYDVGDRVDINGSELIVEHISLLFTVFRQVSTGGIVQIPNIVNNLQWIKNVSRSKAMKERYNFAISPKTKWFQLENLKSELRRFVLEPQNKRDYQPNIDVELISIGDMEKLHLRVEICQKSNFSDEALRASRRSKFMCALFTALKKHSIKKPWGGKPPDAGTWENPAFSVTVTGDDAARARAEWEAREEADRVKKMEKLWWNGLGKEEKSK